MDEEDTVRVTLASGFPSKAPQVIEVKEDNAPKHSTTVTAVAMIAIFVIAPKASPVEGSASGTLLGATASASTSGAFPVDHSFANREASVEDNPWGGYNTPRPDPLTKVKKRHRDEWICPEHGPMCILGFARCVSRLTVTSAGRESAKRERRTRENGWRGKRGRGR